MGYTSPKKSLMSFAFMLVFMAWPRIVFLGILKGKRCVPVNIISLYITADWSDIE